MGAMLERCSPGDVDSLTAFLRQADLTLSGLDSPGVRLWVERAEDGSIVGSTGYELSADGAHALIRSVAVGADHRSGGRGTRLARYALGQATREGATRAWLFSHRSGPFWESLDFVRADRDELAAALSSTHQVALFRRTGQLAHEVAWSRRLG
ncbi:GNAT family N-acetyltransferase [Leifsonia shinshuensis]|uniref:GNAT family N-acetyltransferase n=2 Tax=Leifsonia shinshuensis TaxID=150026 RepID=A0A7G6Y7U1_9MICO|nr:GNAT family N-acetyltransferase [Leifsonia shinshuensis]